MEIANETLFWIIASIITLFIFMLAWALSSSSRVSELYELNRELRKENKKWKEQYDDDIGKSIKEILKSISALKIRDIRTGKTLFETGYFDISNIYWSDKPNTLNMQFDSKEGYEYHMSFKKKLEDR